MLEFEEIDVSTDMAHVLETLRIRTSNRSTCSIKYLRIPRYLVGRDEQLQEKLEALVPNLILAGGTEFVLFTGPRHMIY